jgi:hypothetical protein
MIIENRDSSVGIATARVGARISLFHVVQTGTGATQTHIHWVSAAFSPRVKLPGLDADDHSPPASAEVKKMWIYASTPHTPSWRSA